MYLNLELPNAYNSLSLFLQILEEYNDKYKAMNLVLFDDALEHLTRIHRVIRMSQGHALLVGVGGSGRQSLARLAAFTAGCEVFEITLSRGYGEEDFREDLKQLYHKLGLENKKVHVITSCVNLLVSTGGLMHSFRWCSCSLMGMWLKRVS